MQDIPTIEYLAQQVKDLSDTLRNHKHTGMDLTPKLSSTSLSRVYITDSSFMGDGKTRSGTLTMQLAPTMGDVYVRAGLDAGDFSNAGAKTGFIFGIDDSDSDKVKFYFGSPTAYISFDGTSITTLGAFNVSSINIPDSTTASSFHTDSSGNSWWGANVASGSAAANASITAAGFAKFKDIQIGGAQIQYQVVNSGIFTFGDGSDGAAVLDGSATPSGMTKSGSDYTMTRDVYYTDMTMSTGTTLNPAGFRVFGTGTLTMNGTASIARNGNNGTDGINASAGTEGGGGTGGAAPAAGYLAAGAAGANGHAGGRNQSSMNGQDGDSGAAAANCLGLSGIGGGAGGGSGGFSGTGGAAGGGGVATTSNVKLIANWHLATLLDISSTGSTVKFTTAGGAGSGGAGAGGGTSQGEGDGHVSGRGGGGGAGGSSGGPIAIYYRVIVIGASATISSNGGNGGKGGNGYIGVSGTTWNASGGSGGGGGSGGNGGQIILVYNSYTNSGAAPTAAAGTGATFGTGAAKSTGKASNSESDGTNGSAGASGQAGTVRQFQVSL